MNNCSTGMRSPTRFRTLGLFACATFYFAHTASAITFTVTNLDDTTSGSATSGSLRDAIIAINASTDATNGIVFSPGLSGVIAPATPYFPVFNNVVIDGAGANIAISGASPVKLSNQNQSLLMLGVDVATQGMMQVKFPGSPLANRIAVTIANLEIRDGLAIGGQGLGGGGGMGAGGGVFVNGAVDVTLSSVMLNHNQAIGGYSLAGGGSSSGGGGGLMGNAGSIGGAGMFNYSAQSGGGMFALGGDGGGGFDGGANGGFSTGSAGAPGTTILAGVTGSGGAGYQGGAGGVEGGGGGAAAASSSFPHPALGGSGGGGFGGADGTATAGGDGGFGGGGGASVDASTQGGNGGFGGGGGAGGGAGGFGAGGGGSESGGGGNGGFGGGGGSGTTGGAGGFGGGGGGGVGLGSTGGKGGFGGADGASGGPGGSGAGFGGSLFVAGGATLTVDGVFEEAASAVSGGAGSYPGASAGSGIFLQGSGTLSFAPDAGETQTVADAIEDEDESGIASPSGYTAGQWSLQKNGAGTLVLAGVNAYFGNTDVNSGTLRLTGSIAACGVHVASSAILTGDGFTCGATIDGAIVPGTAIDPTGVFYVAYGQLVLHPGALACFHADGSGLNSSIAAAFATLDGVARIDFAATPAVGQTYALIQSSSLSGAFTGWQVNTNAIDGVIGYSSTDVTFTVTATDGIFHSDFQSGANDDTQCAAAFAD